jgi:hypothetical protein
MITEEAYAPYLSKITFDAKKPLKQGTWELNDFFMSGPLLIMPLLVQSHFSFRGFVILGRDLMHELESIIKSVEVQKKIVFIFFSL